MTRRLYYDDSYLTEFRAQVVRIERPTEGRAQLFLDATAFYPTGGGQLHDLGTLDGVEIVDVLDLPDGIAHVIASATAFWVGKDVLGRVDSQRRRHHRQQHTGQHVLSRVLEDELGLPTLSSRLGETGNTLDVASEQLSSPDLERAEDLSNRVIWEGHRVQVCYLSPADATRTGLRKKVERSGPVRVIEVEGVDRCACGGTHVRNSAEIGLIAITRSERMRGGTRVHFLCGDAALRLRRERHRWLAEIARDLTTGEDELRSVVRGLLEETKHQKKRLAQLARETMRLQAAQWLDQSRTVICGGQRLEAVVRRVPVDLGEAIPEALHVLTEPPGMFVVLVASSGDRHQVYVARSAEVDVDCGAWLREALEPLGGRGGGRSETARGGFAGDDLQVFEARVSSLLGWEEAPDSSSEVE
jgi:alanyl-tRNA synthetase